MAFTVTATESGSSAGSGMQLLVRVLTNAVETGGASHGAASATGVASSGSLTPAFSSSWVGFSVSGDNFLTNMPAAAANNTYDYNAANVHSWSAAQGHYTGTVTASSALTYGAGSAGSGQDHGNWCAYEVPASGGTITIDASSPAGVSTTSTAAATASFTPPGSCVLVAMVCADGTGTGTGITVTITDTSGLGLTWTRRAISSTSDNFQPTYVFTATIGGAAAAPAPGIAQARPGRTWLRRFRHRQQPPPPPGVVLPAGGTSAAAGAGQVTAVATQIATGSAAGAGSVTASTGTPYITAISADNTYFLDNQGNPRLFVGEDCWYILPNAGRWNAGAWQSTFDTYLSQRAAQGYTAVEVSVFGDNNPNASLTYTDGRDWDGTYPFSSTNNPSTAMNSTFWARRDYFFTQAAANGITVVCNLTTPALSVSAFPTGWTTTQWTNYGTAIGGRYKNQPNILWIVADDYFGAQDTGLTAMLSAIRAAGDTHPITIQYYQENTSRTDIDNTASHPAWGASNAQYDWVYTYNFTYLGIEVARAESSPVPVIWGDGFFIQSGTTGITDVNLERRMLWWALSSGARGGVSTGDNEVYKWDTGSAAKVTGKAIYTTWMPAIAAAYSGIAWWKLTPDTSNLLVTAGRGTKGTAIASGGGGTPYTSNSDAYVTASRASDSTLAVIYMSHASTITIDQTKMVSGYTATWVDPASGATSSATPGTTYNSGSKGSNSVGDADWVLILQGPSVSTGTASAAGAASVTAKATVIAPAAAAAAAAATAVATQIAGASAAGAAAVTAKAVQIAPAAAAGGAAVTAVATQIAAAAAAGAGSVTAAGSVPRVNDFEEGTSGTAITGANSAGTGETAFDNVNTPSGSTTAYDNAHAAHGTLAAKIATTTSGAAYLEWFYGTSQATGYYRVYGYCTANPAAAISLTAYILSGVATCARVILNPGGTLSVLDAASGTIFTTTATIPLNAWWRIEGFITGHATAGQAELKLFTGDSTTATETQTSTAAQNTHGVFDTVRYGVTVATASVTAFWLDDLGASPAGYLGPASGATTATGAAAGAATATAKAVQAAPASAAGAGAVAAVPATQAAPASAAGAAAVTNTATGIASAAAAAAVSVTATATQIAGATAAGASAAGPVPVTQITPAAAAGAGSVTDAAAQAAIATAAGAGATTTVVTEIAGAAAAGAGSVTAVGAAPGAPATYRLFPAATGPSSPISYAGNFLCGVIFKVTQGGMWFTGYYKWVAAGGDTAARKFALWQVRGAGLGTLVPAATVTSGTLTAGQWNFVPLATPVPLAIGTAYNACTGWTAVNGFEDSDTAGAGTGAADSFGTGGHTAGITTGPLVAFSDHAFSNPEPWGNAQGVFSTAGTDPAAVMPATGSSSGNFWMDVQVSDTDPAGYAGPYRLWPGKADTNPITTTDSPINYDVATEFAISQPCLLNKIWYYSPAGTAQLATSASVWAITGGGLTGTLAAGTTSPSWSGAAASGWISCTFTGVTLPPGKYKVSVYNNAGTPDNWGAKDANTDYWRNGEGGGGITWGPLSAPNLSAASLAYDYDGSAGGATPPFTHGVTLAGQPTFTQGPPDSYPYLVAPVPSPTSGSTQNYWVDVEVSIALTVAAGLAAGSATAGPVPAVQIAPATAAGAGSVTAAGSVTGQSTGTAAGAGAATAIAKAVQAAGAALTAAGSAGPAAVTQAAASALAAAASVTALAAQQATAAAAAASTATAAGSIIGAGATGTAAGAATVTAAATQITPATSAAAGSVTTAATQIAPATAAGTAAVTAAGAVSGAGTATVTAAASVTAKATQIAGASAAGSGSVTAAATRPATATAAAAAQVTAAGYIPGTANVAGAGTATAKAVQAVAATAAATATLSALATQRTTATLTAAATATASARVIAPIVYGTAVSGTTAIPRADSGTSTTTAAHAIAGDSQAPYAQQGAYP